MTNLKNDFPLGQPTEKPSDACDPGEPGPPAISTGSMLSACKTGDEVSVTEKATLASRMADALRCYD